MNVDYRSGKADDARRVIRRDPNRSAITRDLETMLLIPAFLVLFLFVRGMPVFLYRHDIGKGQLLPFALAAAVPSLSIIVVITEVGVRTRSMHPDIAAALVGAALLSVLIFPTIAGVLLAKHTSPDVADAAERPKGAP